MASGFVWEKSPTEVFIPGYAEWTKQVFDALYRIMVEEAPLVEQFMRRNARWQDDCMPGREYLRAIPFRDDDKWEVGIVAFYDLEVYRANCPEAEFDWGIAHETKRFQWVGKISVILPDGGNPSVLGDEAKRIWARIEALFQ